MHRSPRALISWVAALIVALATARFVAADLAALHRSARAFGSPSDVVVAANDLPLGSTVGRDDTRTVRIATDDLPPGTLHNRRSALGRTVAVPVLAGAPVLERALAPEDRSGLDGLVPEGSRAIRLSDEAGLAPRPGSVVDVLVTIDPSLVAEAGGGDPTVVVARSALVLASGAEDSTGGHASTAPDATGNLSGAGSSPHDTGVTLLVTEAEAKRLAFATAHGVVTLALAPPEDACCRTSSSGSSRD